MSGTNKIVAELIRGLKHERDELKLQLHLGSKEVKRQWELLDKRIEQLDQDYTPLKHAVKESSSDLLASLKVVGGEIKEGFERIRKSLN